MSLFAIATWGILGQGQRGDKLWSKPLTGGEWRPQLRGQIRCQTLEVQNLGVPWYLMVSDGIWLVEDLLISYSSPISA